MASSSSSPWPPPPARRLPLANRSNLSSASPSPSPAPRSSKLPPPPAALANKENAHPLLLPPTSPSDSSAPLYTPTPHAASLASSLWHDSATFRDVVRPSSHLQAHRDHDASVEDQKRAGLVDPLLQPDGTPARPANAVDVESFISTPLCVSSEDPLSTNGSLQLYSRRKPTGTANLTMSCPPLDRSRTIRDKGDRVTHWPLKRGYDFTYVEEAQTSQGTSKKSKNRSRRRSLPEPPSKDWLPESFVAVQRSYFAEVDAFELSEEEAGSEDD